MRNLLTNFNGYLTTIIGWIKEHQELVQLLSGLYLLFFMITIIVLILVVINLPQNYFSGNHRQTSGLSNAHPILWHTVTFSKNLLGAFLILFGIVLLVLPGQGVLTILIGLTMINFPGKYRLERKLVSKPAVNKVLNYIRKLANKPLLEVPGSEK